MEKEVYYREIKTEEYMKRGRLLMYEHYCIQTKLWGGLYILTQ